MTSREAPGGDSPSAATPAQVVDAAARVQMLEEALAQEQARALQLTEQLAQEQARAEKVAQSRKRTQARIEVKVRVAARQGWTDRPMNNKRIHEVAGLVGETCELARESNRVLAQIQESLQASERAQSRVQQLERALALAMAQARSLARAQAQARSPRSRAIAVARVLWQLTQARRGLWDGLVRNLYLGMRVVALAAWMLPAADRARWKQESYSELETLKQEEAPLLGDAIRTALRIPWLALVLRTHAWGRSPTARCLARRKPLWIGLGTAATTFWSGAAGIGQSPTDWQMRSLVAASLLAGVVAASQASRGRRPRRRRRKRRR